MEGCPIHGGGVILNQVACNAFRTLQTTLPRHNATSSKLYGRFRRVVLSIAADIVPGLVAVAYPFFADHMPFDEVRDTDDLWPSAVRTVALSVLSTALHAQQAHPLFLWAWCLRFDGSSASRMTRITTRLLNIMAL